MIGFIKNAPIYSMDEIPAFKSIDDLLTRAINNVDDAISVALYNVNGECIAVKENQNHIINK